MRRRFLLLLLLALLLLALPFGSLAAQDTTTLTVALPEIMRGMISDSAFADFESANGVTVQVVYVPQTEIYAPSPASGIDDHLDAIARYAAAADVLAITSDLLTLEATRAGYFLDLTPLTSADASLNPDDFIPALWQSFQWDSAVWAIPVSGDAPLLIYDPAAFDQAGLSYPDPHWTLDDLANAARTLTQRDASGQVTMPGLATFGDTVTLLRSLYGRDFGDGTNPTFNDPALEDLLTQWKALEDEGIISPSFSGEIDSVPMRILGSFGLTSGLPGSQSNSPAASLLPGGATVVSAQGFAVSSGSTHPELAYALAAYLSQSAVMANNPFGGFPARKSLAGSQPPPPQTTSGSAGGGVTFSISRPPLFPDGQAALDNALASALPVQLFSAYVQSAVSAMDGSGTDAVTALQDAQALAVSNLQAADDRRASTTVIVATPLPSAVLAPGKIALNFGISSNIMPMPNRDRWEQLSRDFAASDPDVGLINLDTNPGALSDYAGRDDCFYLPYNGVPSADTTALLSLDPFTDADSSFDPGDIVGGILTQLQRDNQTWAYPLALQVQALSYNTDVFTQAGIPTPDSGWTIESFVDALKALKDYTGKAPLVPRDPGGSYLLMLIAAYGGLPLDYRTTPITVNFTDPATVDAIRQVLDLAKNGYIDYQALAKNEFRVIVSSDQQDAIVTSGAGGGLFETLGGARSNPYRLAAYPSGQQYKGALYQVGTGYVSATAQNPDACYRWLSYLARHADVFGEMPALRSQIDQSGSADAAFYHQYDALLQQPNTVVFPSAFAGDTSPGDFILQYWLNRAFDRYVLDNADLDAELSDAQTFATVFQQCVAALPAPSDKQAMGQAVTDCATRVDPTVSSLFTAGISSSGG